MRVIVDYPDASEEAEIVRRMGGEPPTTRQVLALDDVRRLQAHVKQVYVDHQVLEYAISLVIATRRPVDYGLPELDGLLAYGASPRASLGLVAAGRALALLRGRSYVVPQDIFDVGYEVLNHRLVLSYDALADDRSAGELVGEVLSRVPAPRVTTWELHGPVRVG